MYACICNGIKETDVTTAVKSGARTVRQVFAHHGSKPDCANCVNRMRKMIDQEANHHCHHEEQVMAMAAE